MLNTLYPPTGVTAPTRQLTPHVLSEQRQAFFRWITGVEKNGKRILTTLETQGRRPGDINGWAGVRDIVDKYLRTANGVIEDCMDVFGPEYFRPRPEPESFQRHERRTDSGVSFNTGGRPSTEESNPGKSISPTTDKPLPKFPPRDEFSPSKKRTTKLEWIAREFRNLRTRNEVREIPHAHQDSSNESLEAKPHSLRKMRSTSSIRDVNRGTSKSPHMRSGSGESGNDFNYDAERRRAIFEAQQRKASPSSEGISSTMGRP